MQKQKQIKLKQILEEAHQAFLKSNEISNDALEPALKYQKFVDIEFAAFLCSVLAYGRIEQIKKSIHKILDPMGKEPTNWLKKANDKTLLSLTKNWKHRFNTSSDMFKLLKVLKHVYSNHKNLEFFVEAETHDNPRSLINALNDKIYFIIKNDFGFTDSLSTFSFFLPDPNKGSACKRMNLFLKWMVRDSAPDLGLWKTYSKKNLIIPLDTHVFKQAQSLKLTQKNTANWDAALEITEALKHLNSDDPTKFDFALCHLGVRGKIIRI